MVPKTRMKRILKRFKYNRAAIFRHYRKRRLRNKTNVQFYCYTHAITQYTKDLFEKFNPQIMKKIMKKITESLPMTNLLEQFLCKITRLMRNFLSINC